MTYAVLSPPHFYSLPTTSDKTANDLQALHRFAELGRVSASLLHEISNPLTAAIVELERTENPRAGITQARQSLELIRHYVEAARQQLGPHRTSAAFRIETRLRPARRILLPRAQAAGVQLRFSPAPNCRLYGDPVKFQHVITNLVVNAIDAYHHQPTGSPKTVDVRLAARRKELVIRVTDHGGGIAAQHLPHIFEPFYTTKVQTSDYGLGIGLAMVREYVTEDFGGRITAASSAGKGTEFCVTLPLYEGRNESL